MNDFTPKTQVEPSHYSFDYDSKNRFITYWYQIKEVLMAKPENVLEIGCGTGVTASYLTKKSSAEVTTLDIDLELDPDVGGSIHRLPFSENHFDTVVAFEVLEHIPYDLFKKALIEIGRVTKKKTIISVPDARRYWKIDLRFLGIRNCRKLVTVPRLSEREHKFDGEHYWELGKQNYPYSKISNSISEAGFTIQNDYRVFESPGKHFFILEPSGS